ncbi:glycosyltransferase family 2 protein [Alicyclobacillus macrosporangiidus]|uniref:Tetratricopeptide repeat-containing protein n=1 Tax=Alicyclobacillus macrosporangiidus TaxID=392015 RepID=A0A1I7IEQ0_9BACL|nr:glycosyltransferase family 2 protein [Alicyclobacillus macrosporangiidus]SFU71387.1 Tetratricopeptide repeat-containing protein [Alicyclobacillus macrosporangiidus]
MKSNEQIIELIKQRKFDSVRYAAIDRLTLNRIDAQAWTFLGQAMVGLKRGRMAKLCFERAALLDPFATWIQQAWRDAEAAGEGREDKAVLRLLEVPHVTVSACILTRDSSRTIRQCLEALQGAVDEIVVVDTGSTDDTVQIVESFGIPVHNFEWCDDFAAARNYALSFVTSEWAIAIDSDEILYPEDRDNIRIAAALFTGRSLALTALQMNRINGQIHPLKITRMHQLSDGMRWADPIHEFLETHDSQYIQTTQVRIRFFHDGYDPDVVSIRDKCQRNIGILERAIHDNPNNVRFHYYLAREYFHLGEHEQALGHAKKADELSRCEVKLALVPSIRKLLYDVCLACNDRETAADAIERLTADFPDYPDGWYLLGVIRMGKGDHIGSRSCFERAMQLASTYRGTADFDPSIRQKAEHMLRQLTT